MTSPRALWREMSFLNPALDVPFLEAGAEPGSVYTIKSELTSSDDWFLIC